MLGPAWGHQATEDDWRQISTQLNSGITIIGDNSKSTSTSDINNTALPLPFMVQGGQLALAPRLSALGRATLGLKAEKAQIVFLRGLGFRV